MTTALDRRATPRDAATPSRVTRRANARGRPDTAADEEDEDDARETRDADAAVAADCGRERKALAIIRALVRLARERDGDVVTRGARRGLECGRYIYG